MVTINLKNVFLLVLSFSLIGVVSCFSQAKKINNQELLELKIKGDLQLVDVRTPEEVAEGKIEGAQNIDFRDPKFKEEISTLDKNKPVVVYCGAGGRSGKTSALLQELGFKEIYDLSGGFTQWKAESFPVVNGE
jgi:rhodanese-related sulfurtransferase